MSEELELMLAERAIARVLNTYPLGAHPAFEWRRTDPVSSQGGGFADTYTRGVRGPDDIVWHILDD